MFGKSLFESVLSRVEAEREEEEARPDPSARIRGFSTGFVMGAMEGISVSLARPDDAYLAFVVDAPAQNTKTEAENTVPNAPPPMPTRLARQLPQEIAADLGLSAEDTIADLQERRRRFARENHPDIIDPAYRSLAHIRMTTANLLIDQEIRKIEAMRALGLKMPR